jgi:hypothetical protein
MSARAFATVFGIVFLVAGAAGFVPGWRWDCFR